MNTAPKMVTRVKVFVLLRKIWDIAYLSPRSSAKNVSFRIGKKTAAHFWFPRVTPLATPHLHDAATKDLFHLIGSRHALQEVSVRTSAEFPHKLLTHEQADRIFVPASAIGGTHRELRGRPTWPGTVPYRSSGV